MSSPFLPLARRGIVSFVMATALFSVQAQPQPARDDQAARPDGEAAATAIVLSNQDLATLPNAGPGSTTGPLPGASPVSGMREVTGRPSAQAGTGVSGAELAHEQADLQQPDIAQLILRAARKHRVGADLIAAVAAAESRFDPRALSPKGAQGIMQLMPATARRFGVRDVWSAEDNIDGGTAYLRWLLDYFSGDTTLAVAAYNAGEQAVLRAGRRIPPFEETRRYVPKVLAWRAHYARALAGLASTRSLSSAAP